MRYFRTEILITLMLLAFGIAMAGDSINESDINQKILDELYPHDIDTLEEFIQSYYLLLDSEEYLSKYSFLDTDDNVIRGDSMALAGFYNKLVALRSGLIGRVTIYQIGDSHIQSGYFAGTARSALQKHFGNAGRGLSFPYRLAGTNQPDDYRISTSKTWSRNPSNVGLSGFTVSSNASGSFTIKTNDFFGSGNKHDLIRFITNNDACSWGAPIQSSTVESDDGVFTHTVKLSSLAP